MLPRPQGICGKLEFLRVVSGDDRSDMARANNKADDTSVRRLGWDVTGS